jgi:glycosyltransferase involved in cell wall biosynthesis
MMRISVAIPLRNEANNVDELLRRLLAQTRPPEEIIIADGGSTDSTPEIVSDFIGRGAPVKLIRAGEAFPGRGRNVAAAEASGDWLAFIDGGIEPALDWLETLAARAEIDETIDVVYGAWEPITDSFFAECAAITYVPPPIARNGVVTRPRFIASSLMKRSVWRSVGGFPEDLRSGEDLLFMDKIERAGFNSVFEPRGLVRWHLRPTLTSTFKRFVVYARNNIRAGLWRQWQAAIFTRYLLLFAIAVVSVLVSPKLLWLPFGLWLLMLLMRAIVSIHRNRACYPASASRNLKRLVLLIPLLATIDAAAFIGSIQWLFFDWFRGQRTTAVEAGDGA